MTHAIATCLQGSPRYALAPCSHNTDRFFHPSAAWILATVELVANKDDNYMKFSLIIRPTDGLWAGGLFEFKFEIPDDYPWGSPVCTCVDKIWHPNIDLQGKPCVNVLQKNWKPTFTIETVVFGLLFLFSDPNPHDPLNIEAAEEMRTNPVLFKRNVLTALRGGVVHGTEFPPNRGNPSLFGSKH